MRIHTAQKLNSLWLMAVFCLFLFLRNVNCFEICFTILQSLRFHAKSWLPARSIVMECLSARWDVDPSGEIMVLNRFCPVSMAILVQCKISTCSLQWSLIFSSTNRLIFNIWLVMLKSGKLVNVCPFSCFLVLSSRV